MKLLKQQKIYIRVDAGPNIGHGHFVRCVSLAKIIEKKYKICFSCIQISEIMQKELSNLKYTLFKLKNENEFLNNVCTNDIVIVDHNEINSDYLREIKSKTFKLISIDDLHDKFFYSDLIINHTPGITKKDYKCTNETTLALGPKFSLLRASFINAANNTREISSIKTALICFGGSDEYNFNYKAAEVLVKSNKFELINIVIGSDYKYKNQILEFSKHNSNVIVRFNINENEMCNLMLNTDLSIIPASSLLLESISCGMMCIICAYVNNQKLLHDYMIDKLNVPSFSDGLTPNFEKLKSIIENKKLIMNQNTKSVKTDISSARKNLLKIISNTIIS
jgi:UDP-2,4-diacetamido-2,4,6-trideoxy-beta-L-altropyranose hydrolase